MTDRRALLVDAFADEPLAGNAAGVVPDADNLTDEQMRAVARELGASETAFLRSSDDADRRLRFFSPSAEVDLCGHATIATHAHLHREGVIPPGVHTVETNAGVFDVEVTDEGVTWLAGATPVVSEVAVDTGRVGDALGIDPAALRDVGADLPTAVATTGLPYLVVPVNFLEHLSGADPDDAAVAALAAEHDTAGVYAFTFDAIDRDSTLHGRAFVPSLGVSEDPVTGTASGAVAAYCRAVGAFDNDVPDEIRCEQGHFLDRPGVVRVRFVSSSDGVETVWVGGRAPTALDGQLTVPPDEGDGIIEA